MHIFTIHNSQFYFRHFSHVCNELQWLILRQPQIGTLGTQGYCRRVQVGMCQCHRFMEGGKVFQGGSPRENQHVHPLLEEGKSSTQQWAL